MELKVLMESRAHRVQLEVKVIKAREVVPDPRDLRVLLEHKVLEVQMAPKDQMVFKELKVVRAAKVLKGKMDLKVQLGQEVPLGLRVLQVAVEFKGLRVIPGLKAQ
jgi:hypothetical protein